MEQPYETTEKAVFSLLQKKNRLEMQILERKSQLLAASQDIAPNGDSTDIQAQLDRISNLQHELQKVSAEKELSNRLLHRLLMTQALSRNLFPPSSVGKSGDMNDDAADKEKYVSLVQRQSALSSAVLKIHAKMDKLRPELDAITRHNLELVRSNRLLMGELKQNKDQAEDRNKKAKKNDAVISAQEKIDATVSKLEVCRHTFQGLVLGSGVHWAADDALKQTVLQLGKPIQEILEDSNK